MSRLYSRACALCSGPTPSWLSAVPCTQECLSGGKPHVLATRSCAWTWSCNRHLLPRPRLHARRACQYRFNVLTSSCSEGLALLREALVGHSRRQPGTLGPKGWQVWQLDRQGSLSQRALGSGLAQAVTQLSEGLANAVVMAAAADGGSGALALVDAQMMQQLVSGPGARAP